MEARKQPTHVPNFWQSFEWRELKKKKKKKKWNGGKDDVPKVNKKAFLI